jgi:hypothetical protein
MPTLHLIFQNQNVLQAFISYVVFLGGKAKAFASCAN